MESYVKRLLTQPGNAIIYLLINVVFEPVVFTSTNFINHEVNNYINFSDSKRTQTPNH